MTADLVPHEDLQEARLGMERLQDLGDPVLDRGEVKHGLFTDDEG